NANFNFAPYDQDGDCQVDVANIVHQGSGEEASGLATDIWSHSWDLNSARAWNLSHYGAYTTKSPCTAGGYITVSRYVIQPEILWSDMTTVGVFAHEYGHALGLPDLYDYGYDSAGVGSWSLMAGGTWNYAARQGDRPAHPDAWSKYKLGWIAPILIGSGSPQSPTVQPAYAYASVYQLLNGSPSLGGEYFLIENRQKGGFDIGLPGSGLLVWHIDESQTTNNNQCYPGGPSCAAQHYHVALVQADNLWDLEKDQNQGDGGDPYPGTSNQSNFTSGSAPSSQLYSGAASSVSITNIAVSGSNVTATLSADGDPASNLLAVAKAGTGIGAVTSDPAGINCGNDCTENYASGTIVTLTATAAAGSTFTGWSGSCTGTSATCTVTMNTAKSVTATFTLNTTPPSLVVSAGHYYTCGLRIDGTAACWGYNGQGQANSPTGVFAQVSAGYAHTCWLRRSGTVDCLGWNTDGQATPPTGSFTQVSAGGYHSCGLRSDRTVACWGNNTSGQASPPTGTFTQISAGAYHTCGLRSDGTVACWGNNYFGQINPPAGSFIQISSGGNADFADHACGLRSDGTIACWGASGHGQTSPPAGSFIQVSASGGYTCGLRSNGNIACWGSNTYGQASPPAGVFTQISAGGSHTCGLRSDGIAFCWGDNQKGQLGPTLTISKTGSGTVTSSPAGISCGSDCTESYVPLPAPAVVTLTATAAAGSTFAGWSGACSGTGGCVVTMDAAKSVTATFTADSSTSLRLAGLTASGLIYYTTNLSTWTNIPGALAQLQMGDFDGDGKADDLAGVNGAGAIYYTTDLRTWRNIPGNLVRLVAGDFD
ncbi:MAG: M6 family metalloprotease domain-containing protein, partial [Candidatus Competibacter sp.]|nr:M6 family metalloprotease domain-containing protein [Candidatus Competibacter sp.]